MTRSDSFLEQFFGAGNVILWSRLQSPAGEAMKRELAPFLDLYASARRDDHGIAVLPRRMLNDELHWYVLSRNAASARHAWEIVNAYLGPSYSDIGEGSELSPGDPLDQLVQDEFGRHCFSVRVPSTLEEKETVRARLCLMAETLGAHSRRGATRRNTVGRILGSFEQALESGDEAAANENLELLRSSGHLDAMNMAFLEVRRDGALLRWSVLLARPDLVSIIDVGVPRKVAELLLRAIFETELAGFEQGAQGAAAFGHFRMVIEPRYRPLYRTRAGLEGYEVDAQILLAAALRGQPREAYIDALLARYDEQGPRRRFLESIVQLLPARSQPSPPPDDGALSLLDSAQKSFSAGDIDSAFASAAAAAPSPARTTWMLSWALEMDVPEALTAALAAYEGLPEAEREAFSSSPRNKRVLALVGNRLGLPAVVNSPSAAVQAAPPKRVIDWPSWLQRLTQEEEWTGAVAAASQGESLWRLDSLAGSPDAIGEAKKTLQSRLPSWATEALSDALPCLVRAWLEPGISPSMKPIYTMLCQLLLTDSIRSLTSASALVRVVTCLAELGRPASDYTVMVGKTAEYLRDLVTPGMASIALEALEGLIDRPCPNTDARESFARVVETIHLGPSLKIGAIQLNLLRQLLREVGVTATAPATTEAPLDPSWRTLSGCHVALYSPNGLALERARTILQSSREKVNVSTFETEAGGGVALREASRSADVFVIASGCAKHSTTRYVAEYRPRSRPTLTAAGTGSSTLIAAIDGWLGKSSMSHISSDAADLEQLDERTTEPAVLAEIGLYRNRLEPKLRTFIKRLLKSHLGDAWIKPILEALPTATREQLVGVDANKILKDRLLLSNLITVLQVGWDKYFKVLERGAPSESVKKASVLVLLDFLNAHREDAHAKPLSDADRLAVKLVVETLEGALEKHLQD